jgi:hypothetical protein
METVDIILYALILIVCGLIYCKTQHPNVINNFTNKYFKKTNETLINTDNSRMKELSKCCTDEKCYSKPPMLRENCEENKVEAKKELDKQFDQFLTQEEYFKRLNELNVIKTQDLPNIIKDQEFVNKMNERISIDKAVGTSLYNKIIADKQDEVCGYNIKGYAEREFAPFVPRN